MEYYKSLCFDLRLRRERGCGVVCGGLPSCLGMITGSLSWDQHQLFSYSQLTTLLGSDNNSQTTDIQLYTKQRAQMCCYKWRNVPQTVGF